MDENENTTTQNLWDTVKAVLRGKFIAIEAYLKKQEKSQINNLTLHLKQLEKEEKNPRVSRREEILKIEIIPSIFSDHNAVRLDLNYRRKPIKIPTYGG